MTGGANVAASVSARAFGADERCRFRASTRPGLRVVARLTQRCVMGCRHCLAAAGDAGDDLPLAAWQTILAELPAVGAHKVLLTGGEPLLFAGLAELTATIAALGVSTDLNSTLWDLTPRRALELAAAGLTEASISLEGPEAVHDCLHRRPGAWRRLRAGVALLQDAGLPVDGSLCLGPENLPHVEATIATAAGLGLASFTVSRRLPVGHGQRTASERVSAAALADLHARLADARAGRYGLPVRCVGLLGPPHAGDCGQARSLVGIAADGVLTPCVLSRDRVPQARAPLAVGLATALADLRAALDESRAQRCWGGETGGAA